MPIPESQLETWAHQGSIAQSSATYAIVKRALDAGDTKYADKDYEIFLQGSYGNDTNIYAESDVDIVIRLDSIYHYDVTALTPQELSAYDAARIAGTYAYRDYKEHVVSALKKSFGSDVRVGAKAIRIEANGSRRSADVVVATLFRKYHSYSVTLGPRFEPGICFFNSNGQRIENYPKQHSANCTSKHQSTNEWFKPMVRILKNMRSRLVEDGTIAKGSAPSYFLEGLLFNVPDHLFGKSYGATFVAAANWINQANRVDLICANSQHYLVRDNFSTCWPSASCDVFIDAAIELWKKW